MKRHDDSISDRLRRMAATDELSVGRGRAEQIASRALARSSSRPRLRSLAAAVAGSAFAIVSVTGLGAVADSAVPGDSLYPVDRAYEAVARAIGRDTDRTQETLQEAITLAQRGSRDRAAVHVATELGRFIVPEEPGAEQVLEAISEATASLDDSTPTQESAAPQVASEAASVATAPVPAESAPILIEESIADAGDDGDPFLLALQNALRATQAAAGTDDELIAAEADEAVRSVVKLAAGAAEKPTGTLSQVAPNALSVPETTTTTTTTVARGNSDDAPGNNTSSTTTTSVPDDSEETLPGDGDTAGDDSGGSQEGSGDAGEPGGTGGDAPGPIILPIP